MVKVADVTLLPSGVKIPWPGAMTQEFLYPGELLTTETDGSQYVTGLPEVADD